MGAAIGEILGEAVGVAISPIPIIAVVLFLSSPKRKGNALGFLIGWLVGLAAIGAIVLLIADPAGASTNAEPATWVGWLVLALGLFSMLIGIREWRARPTTGEEPPMPTWMSALDQFTWARSFTIGLALSALGPKNLTLTLAAAAAIATAGLSLAESAVTFAIFVAIGTLGVVAPIAIYYLGGARASETLAELRHWLAVHNAAIVATLMLVIGAKLVGSGLQLILS